MARLWMLAAFICWSSFWAILSTLSLCDGSSISSSVVGGCTVDECSVGKECGNEFSCAQPISSPYLIIIDGGSTGSRLHVYYYNDTSIDVEIQLQDVPSSIVRLGSARAWSPLSAYCPTPTKIYTPSETAEHLIDAFQYAIDTIPPQYHSTTTVKYAATAGMRLLSEEDQKIVYKALYDGLTQYQNFTCNFSPLHDNCNKTRATTEEERLAIGWPFRAMKLSDIFTLSGSREGFYGMVAANYLAGRIHTNLVYKEKFSTDGPRIASDFVQNEACFWDGSDMTDEQTCRQSTVDGISSNDSRQQNREETLFLGSLDMGGSSTQIVYRGASAAAGANITSPLQLQEDEFFATSYLSYGVDQFRNRMWDMWVKEASEDVSDGSQKEILNPCFFPGYNMEYKNFVLKGTGDAEECTRQIHRLIPSLDHDKQGDGTSPHKLGRAVGGITHPPLPPGGNFYAMSLYYFSLDCLRELAYPHEHDAVQKQILESMWPSPSLHQLRHALHGFCARSWHDDLANLKIPHKFTRSEVLPHRCFEATYMTTLLLDGFGFDPHSRDITFTFDVMGQEVEWTLGMALSLISNSSTTEAEPTLREKIREKTPDTDESLLGMNVTEKREINEKGKAMEQEDLLNAQYAKLVEEIRVAYFLDMFGYHHTL